MTLFAQIIFNLFVVLNDSVMDYCDFLFTVKMGMSIPIRNMAVSRPSGVTDCDTPSFKICFGQADFTDMFFDLNFFLLIRNESNTPGIITAVLELFESCQGCLSCLVGFVVYNSKNSAHSFFMSS